MSSTDSGFVVAVVSPPEAVSSRQSVLPIDEQLLTALLRYADIAVVVILIVSSLSHSRIQTQLLGRSSFINPGAG